MASFLRNLSRLPQNRVVIGSRFLGRSAVRFEKTAPTVTSNPVGEDPSKLSGKTHRVNDFEKRMLVWSGKYKNFNDVPAWVTPESVEKARNKTRIRLANYMMLATAFACLLMVISGKKAAERGESVQKANIEWHKRVNEEAMKNQK